VGSIALLRWPARQVRRSGIVISVFGELVPLGLFAIAPSFVTALALLFVSAVFAALYQTRGSLGLQERVAKEMLGRANAVIRFAVYLGMLIGAVVAAAALSWLSWDRLLIIVTALAAVVMLLSLISKAPEPAIVSAGEQFPQALGPVPGHTLD